MEGSGSNVNGMPTHRAYKAALPPSYRRNSHIRNQSMEVAQATQPPSPPIFTQSIDEAIHESQVVIIEESDNNPPVLPELQHLAGPPPPPPPPPMFIGGHGQQGHARKSSLGVINIAIDDGSQPEVGSVSNSTTHTPAPVERAVTTSPSSHRRGRGSISEAGGAPFAFPNTNSNSGGIGLGSRIRNVTERMRSTSRSRAKSPQISSTPTNDPRPYETVLPPVPTSSCNGRRESLSSATSGGVAGPGLTRAKSPYESSISSMSGAESTPPMQFGNVPALSEQSLPPHTYGGAPGPMILPGRSASAMDYRHDGRSLNGGYRHPKEVRANMPPEQLQQGVYVPGGHGGMI
jgi:hypothetical protein